MIARTSRPAPTLRGFAVAACVALTSLSACEDPSRLFEGQWKADETVTVGDFSGAPSLAIGHFATDLTGVAHLENAVGIPFTPCPCAFIDAERVFLDGERFLATSTLCDGTVWVWDLTIDRDRDADALYLVGELSDDADNRTEIALRRLDAFVPDEERVCDRPAEVTP